MRGAPRLPGARTPGGLQRRFVDTLAWGISILWAFSFIVDMTPYPYDPPGYMGPLMLLVAGGAFATNLIKDKDKPE